MGTAFRIFSVICTVLYGSASAVSSLGAERQNLAFGRPYTLSPEPNYHLASKDPDRSLLTDGIYTKGFFWTQPTTVRRSNTALSTSNRTASRTRNKCRRSLRESRITSTFAC